MGIGRETVEAMIDRYGDTHTDRLVSQLVGGGFKPMKGEKGDGVIGWRELRGEVVFEDRWGLVWVRERRT